LVFVSASRSRWIAKSSGQGRDLAIPAEQVAQTKIIPAFSNLLENALKYSYPGTAIYVRATTLSTGNLDLASAHMCRAIALPHEMRRRGRSAAISTM
jgi:signal transduction histidine kinase